MYVVYSTDIAVHFFYVLCIMFAQPIKYSLVKQFCYFFYSLYCQVACNLQTTGGLKAGCHDRWPFPHCGAKSVYVLALFAH